MNKQMSAPIGIFDSGLGGLTVARSISNVLPEENIIYFGDTARVPYGIKSEETIRNYALQITRFLLEERVKMILIACNTVSASARQQVEKLAGDVPVLDVITAGSRAALRFPDHAHIGVIGTLATIGSGAYEEAIRNFNGDVTITAQACPLLVPLAEEGWTDNEIARQILRTYLEKFTDIQLDSLILGCTHYPVFREAIRELLPDKNIHIIDSGDSIAEMAKEKLDELDLRNNEMNPYFKCYVTDRPQRFLELAERFLGRKLGQAQIVTLP